ncbi:Putative glycosyltransferase EpsH [Thermoflexales bacterium]|nr:Putative glycosyltransferase EpsH [Thermoflexales bacterium]
MPLISVIMPVYNGARFLKKTLASLLAQTCGDWELIVIDDGSTDGTPELLAKYDDPRFVKIRKENGGEAQTRNVGLRQAKGEFIAFLDADDLYLPTALADMSAFLAAQPEYDALFSDGYLCDENERILSRLTEHRSGIYTGNILEALVLTADVLTVPVCTLTRRAVIQQHQVEFDEQLVIGPDWDFWIRLARYARFGYLDKPTCLYRVHLTNITRTSGAQKRQKDLVYGRLKVLNAEWFPELSLPTRQKFFYALLNDLLSNQAAQQQEIFNHPNFQALPAPDRASLLRQVGTYQLLNRIAPDFALQCLRHAVELNPADRKSRFLLTAQRMAGLSATIALLRLWQRVHLWGQRLRSIGQRRARPVPSSLGPVGS